MYHSQSLAIMQVYYQKQVATGVLVYQDAHFDMLRTAQRKN